MDGFVREFAAEYQLDGKPPKPSSSWYDGAVLNVYDAVAGRFLVCDRWFSSHPGPTFCKRFYMLTGRLNRDRSASPSSTTSRAPTSDRSTPRRFSTT